VMVGSRLRRAERGCKVARQIVGEIALREHLQRLGLDGPIAEYSVGRAAKMARCGRCPFLAAKRKTSARSEYFRI
jgi:hypothetical protein